MHVDILKKKYCFPCSSILLDRVFVCVVFVGAVAVHIAFAKEMCVRVEGREGGRERVREILYLTGFANLVSFKNGRSKNTLQQRPKKKNLYLCPLQVQQNYIISAILPNKYAAVFCRAIAYTAGVGPLAHNNARGVR
jgi:hypothetical protein